MFQKHRQHHYTEIVGAGLIGMMLGVASSFALIYPQENRDRAEDLFTRARDHWTNMFEEEELPKPRKARKKLLKS